jgi:hypothetical protein
MAELAFELMLAPLITCKRRPEVAKQHPYARRQIDTRRPSAVASTAGARAAVRGVLTDAVRVGDWVRTPRGHR